MKVVLFHVRTRADIDADKYQQTFEQLLGIVSAMPGFRGIEGFSGEDGSELAVAWFDSAESVKEWKEQSDHLAAQKLGRSEFFASYDITIADVDRRYAWPAEPQPE